MERRDFFFVILDLILVMNNKEYAIATQAFLNSLRSSAPVAWIKPNVYGDKTEEREDEETISTKTVVTSAAKQHLLLVMETRTRSPSNPFD